MFWPAILPYDLEGILLAGLAILLFLAFAGWIRTPRYHFPTACLLLALTWGGVTYPWTSGLVIGLLLAAAVLSAAFLFIESLVKEPLLPLDLFRNEVFAVSGLLALAGGVIFYAMIFYLPLFIQGVLGENGTTSGVSLAPLFVPVAVSAIVGGQLISRAGRYHFLAILGALILLPGLFLLWQMDAATVLFTVVIAMIVVGVGIGLLQPIYTVAGQNAIPLQRLGTGTGAMSYLRAMGSLLGTAGLGSIVTHSASSHVTGLTSVARQALATSLAQVFLVTLGVGVAVFILTCFLKDVRLRRREDESPVPLAAGPKRTS